MINEKANLKLKIADINFEINGLLKDDRFYKQAKEYATDFDKADFCVNIGITDSDIAMPEGKKLTDRLFDNWYIADSGLYAVCIADEVNNRVLARILCDVEGGVADIAILDIKKHYGMEITACTYNMLEILLHFLIVRYNGFVVHASSIAYKGTGLAFSAESGTGKSTHTALWLKNCPNDTVMLNDDKPIFRYFENDGWYIYGTPWAGTTGLNTNLKVPLKALVFLERSKTNSIRRLASAEVISRFFEAVISPMSDEVTDKILELLGLLIEKSNVCLLKCNMEDEAMETVKKFLYE